ncbi:MAG: PH domain-containing protein, partial [Bifidobacteriaceae bacterium]|nr:PH domain-containing protein [Bifidobacteriaceae bacterium]
VNWLVESWEGAVSLTEHVGLGWIGAGVVGLLAVALLFAWVSWRRASFRITSDAVELATGVVFRQRRHIRLDRIQSVDLVRPLLPRLFGLVSLNIEAAGGADSSINLAFFKLDDADRWRHVILTRAQGARSQPPERATSGDGPWPAGQPPAGHMPAGQPPADGALEPMGEPTPPPSESAPGAAGRPSPEPARSAWGALAELPRPADAAAQAGVDGQSARHVPSPRSDAAADAPRLAEAGPVPELAADPTAPTTARTQTGPALAGGPATPGGWTASSTGETGPTETGAAPGATPPSPAVPLLTPPQPPKSVETRFGEAFGDADAEAPELFAVPTGRVLGSLALSLGVAVIIPALAVAVTVMIASDFEKEVLTGLVPVLGTAAAFVWQRLTSDFGFSAKQTSKGLTLSHGLTTRVSQTIPPNRILALRLSQSALWRPFGWWRVRMNVAGYGGESDSQNKTLLVPVGDAETVRRAIWAVAPGLAQPETWDKVAASMTGKGPAPGFVCAPKRSRWLDPWTWRRNAHTATDEALVLRAGAILRWVTVVPHARIQAIEVRQGPWERRFELATVLFHSAPGPVVPLANHLDAADVARLARDESDRLLAAMERALQRDPGAR